MSGNAELLQVTTTPGGPPVLDLADGISYSYTPDSLTIDATGQQGSGAIGLILDTGAGYTSASDERYGGSIVDYDRRPNGVLAWRAIIMPGSRQTIAQAVATLTTEVERADPPRSRYIAWQRYGSTAPLYFERRGPGTWTPVERWPTGEIATLDIQLPVAPVAYGSPVTTSLTGQQLPNTWALASPGGTLSSLMDVQVSSASQLNWALIAAATGPLGVINAQTATTNTGLGPSPMTVVSDSSARGGAKLQGYKPAFGAYVLGWTFDPSTTTLDASEYEQDLALEVWARMRFNGQVMAPNPQLTVLTPDGNRRIPTLEFGGSGVTLSDARNVPVAPSTPALSTSTSSGTLATGTYQVEITYVTARGESLPSAPASTSLASAGNLTVTSPGAAGSGTWAATGWNYYLTTAGGSTFYKQNGGPIAIGTNANRSTPTNTGGAALPTDDGVMPWGLHRLGTVRVPPDPGNWTLQLIIFPNTFANWSAAIRGYSMDLDYLLLAPARWRACGPTGVTSASGYPSFVPAAGGYVKQISADLTGRGGPASPSHADTGLGGSPLRCPTTGSPRLLLAATPAVPDDQSTTAPEDIMTTVTPTVTLTPRYRLMDAS